MGYIGNQDYNIIETHIGTVTGTDTAANIVALPNDNGALWIASDTGHLFLNDGSRWHDIGKLQGDTGPQGVSVTGISKTSTSGLVDTYTVTFSDMSTTSYTITNGKGIVGVAKTSGDGSEGTLDTYTITYNDSTTSTYDVYNGADGNTWLTGSTAPLAGDGSDGDLYLNTATNFYYKKVAGAWVLKGTLKGDAYSYSAAGALADRGAYDTEAAGFGYLSLDEAVPTVYFKLSSASGDWSIGTAVGRGAGISNVTKTGTLGNVDTYTITYDDFSTSTFTVTNANIDDSQITTTNTWSAEKIVLALDDKAPQSSMLVDTNREVFNPPPNTDLNNLKDSGFYCIAWSTPAATVSGHSPYPYNGILKVFSMGGGEHAIQEYTTWDGFTFFRTLFNNTWQPWREVATSDHTHTKAQIETAIGFAVAPKSAMLVGTDRKTFYVPADTNLNGIKDSGFYSIGWSNPTAAAAWNAPYPDGGVLKVVAIHDVRYLTQEYTTWGGFAFFRALANDVWQPWREVATSHNTKTIGGQSIIGTGDIPISAGTGKVTFVGSQASHAASDGDGVYYILRDGGFSHICTVRNDAIVLNYTNAPVGITHKPGSFDCVNGQYNITRVEKIG